MDQSPTFIIINVGLHSVIALVVTARRYLYLASHAMPNWIGLALYQYDTVQPETDQ
jgi:hypothetical protein